MITQELPPPTSPPIPLGTIVKPWGKVAAVSFRDGERYYMLVNKQKDVALMPASTVEAAAKR